MLYMTVSTSERQVANVLPKLVERRQKLDAELRAAEVALAAAEVSEAQTAMEAEAETESDP